MATIETTAAVLMIVASAALFTWVLTANCVRATLPFLVPLVGVLMMLVLIPEIALWLPGWMFAD